MEQYVGSTEKVAVAEIPSPLPSISTREGFLARCGLIKRTFTSMYHMWSLRRELKLQKRKYSYAAIKEEASTIYLQLNDAIARGDEETAKKLVTEQYFRVLTMWVTQVLGNQATAGP